MELTKVPPPTAPHYHLGLRVEEMFLLRRELMERGVYLNGITGKILQLINLEFPQR